MPKKKKVKVVPNIPPKPLEEEPVNFLGEMEAVATEEPTAEEETTEEIKEEEPKPKPKKKSDYKKTIRFGKDRFDNPRSQRDFETNLRNFLDAEEAYKAWQTWNTGGTVTLVIKK